MSDQPERQAKASKSNYEMKTSRTRREGILWRASLACEPGMASMHAGNICGCVTPQSGTQLGSLAQPKRATIGSLNYKLGTPAADASLG